MKWIEDYIDRDTAVARNWVEDVETAIMQKQEDMWNAEHAGSTTRKPEKTVQEILNTIAGSLSDLASSDNEEDGEDDENHEEDTEPGKQSQDEEPGRVMDALSKTVQQHLASCRQKQMRFDQLTQQGWQDEANNCREIDMTYPTAELNILAVIELHTDKVAATLAPTAVAEHIDNLDVVMG